MKNGVVLYLAFTEHIAMRINHIPGILLLSPCFLNAQSGTLDPSFSSDGFISTTTGFDNEARAVAVQPDGKVLVAGYGLISPGYDFVIWRFNANGTLDYSFSGNGQANTQFAPNLNCEGRSLRLLEDGRFLVAGWTNIPGEYFRRMAVARYLPDGDLDETFGDEGLAILAPDTNHNDAFSMVVQPGGRILLGGYAQATQPRRGAIVGLLPDGAVDSTFGSDGRVILDWGMHTEIAALALHPDGDILAGGHTTYDSDGDVDSLFVARFDQDGSPQNDFGNEGVVRWELTQDSTEVLTDLQVHPDGLILAAGHSSFIPFTTPESDPVVWAFNEDGSWNTAFGTNGRAQVSNTTQEQRAHAMTIDPLGRIVLAGFSDVSGLPGLLIVRLTAQGQLDSGFGNSGFATPEITANMEDIANAVALQPDGKVVVAGWTNVAGYRNFLTARILMDGNVGIDETATTPGLSAFPIPCSHDLHIRLTTRENGPVDLRVIASDGRIVMQRTALATASSLPIRLDVSALPAGVYQLDALAGTERLRQRMVKQP